MLNKKLRLKRCEVAQRREDAIARNRPRPPNTRSTPQDEDDVNSNEDVDMDKLERQAPLSEPTKLVDFYVVREFNEFEDYYYSPDINNVYNTEQLAELSARM